MPRIFGHDLLGIILGAVAFYLIGFLLYGLLFGEYWQQINNVPAGYMPPPMSMAMGLIMPIVSTLGLAWIMNKTGKGSIQTYVTTGLIIAVAFGAMAMMYGFVYSPNYGLRAFVFDSVHLLLAYGAAGAVLGWRQ